MIGFLSNMNIYLLIFGVACGIVGITVGLIGVVFAIVDVKTLPSYEELEKACLNILENDTSHYQYNYCERNFGSTFKALQGAKQEQIELDNALAYLKEMEFDEKLNSLETRCKNLPANASIGDTLDCVTFIELFSDVRS